MARSKEEIRRSLRSGNSSTTSKQTASNVRSRDEIRNSLVTGTTEYTNATNTVRSDYRNSFNDSNSKHFDRAEQNLNLYKGKYGNYMNEYDKSAVDSMASYYRRMSDLYSSPNADALAWASKNSGMTYAQVAEAKKNATGNDLKYLNQYGTLVGYNSLEDYDAEIADTEHTSKWKNVLNNGANTAANTAIAYLGGIPGGLYAGYQTLKGYTNNEDDPNAYYDKLVQARNLYDADHRYDKYASLAQNADYEENSYDVENPDKRINRTSANKNMTNMWEGAALGLASSANIGGALIGGMMGYQKSKAEAERLMTDEEIKTYNYIYNTQGEQAATEYLDDLQDMLDVRSTRNLANELEENTDTFGGALQNTVRRIQFNPMANAASGANIAMGAINGEYNPYSDLGMWKNYTDFAEQSTGQALSDSLGNPQFMGVDVPSFLYSTGLSMADSYIGTKMLNITGEGLGIQNFGANYSVIMGTGAFQSTARQMADQGATQQDIWVKAGAAGIAEIITEHISLEGLEEIINDKGINTPKKFILAMLRQAGYEGSEEVNSDVLNLMVDQIYNGGASEMNQKINQLMQEGMSEAEARRKVYTEFLGQLAESFVGGALSGGGSAFLAGGKNYLVNNSIGKKLRANNNLEYIDNAARNLDQESDAYKNYMSLVGENGSISKASNAQISTTYAEVLNELNVENRNAFKGNIENLLSVRGVESEEVGDASEAVTKLFRNEKLSRKDYSMLTDDRVKNLVNNIADGKVHLSEEVNGFKDRFKSVKMAEQKRTMFQEATNIERTKDGYRITNADGTITNVNNDSLTTTESDVMDYVSKYNESAQTIFLDNYAKSGNIALFDSAFNEVYNMGKNGIDIGDAYSNYANVLGNRAIADIYKAGNQLASEEARMSAEAIDKALADFNGKFKGGKFTSQVEPKRLNSKKRKLYNYARALSALGLNVNVIDDKRATSDNGRFDEKSNSITINLSATFSTKDIKELRQKYVINTFAHELTHYLEYNAKEAYKPLRNMIKEGLQSKLYDYKKKTTLWDEYYNREYRIAKKNGASDEQAMKIAESEVIARACENVLNDNQQMIDILSQGDQSVLKTIKDAIMKFFNEFKDMVKSLMSGFESSAEEAQAINEIDGLLDNMKAAWAEAFTQAIAKSQLNEEQRAKVENAESETGVEVDEENGVAVSTLDSAKRPLSVMWKELGYKSYEECIDDVANDINTKSKIGDVEKVKNWLKSDDSISAFIMREENARYLDYEADDNYEPIKKNSDYPQGTFDLSNLCRKREFFTKMFDSLQKQNPDFMFTADNIAKIRQVLVRENYEVACALCYVEDRRQKMGEIASQFIEQYNKALNSESKGIVRVNSSGNEIALIPTKTQAKKYGIPVEQFKATDDYKITQYDLVTYEGFSQLRKEHPTIAYAFERFNNARGMASARLIEGHAEYARQILKYTDKQIEKINGLGGLRMFSFSDFEAMHLIDVCQVIMDCAKMGIKIQAYTKVPEFAALVRNTGVKVNRSLIAANVGSKNAYARVIENGKAKIVKVEPYVDGIAKYKGKDVLAYDVKEGIDINSKYFLDETNNANIGNILVGVSDEHIRLAMEDPFVDYIIPFHTGQRASVLHAKGLAKWFNYKDYQVDKKKNGKASKGVNIHNLIKNGKITNKYEFEEAFFKAIKGGDYTPRFESFINKDSDGNYQYTEGYWKLLLDFKMFDVNGNILMQENVRPDIDEKLAKKILNEGKTEKIFNENTDEILGKIKEGLAEDGVTLKSTKRDSDGNALTTAQEEYFKDSKARDEDGNLLVMYHGSKMPGFTVFDSAYSDDERSLFFTDTPDMAFSYSGTDYEFHPDKKYTLEELNVYADDVSDGNWEVKKDGDDYVIIEAGDYEEYRGTIEGVRDYIIEFQSQSDFTENGANYKVYINLTNPLIVDANGAQWNDLSDSYEGELSHDYSYAYLYGEEDDDLWEIEYEDFGEGYVESFTREELEEKFGEDEALMLINGDELGRIMIDKDGNRVPTNTRDYSKLAQEQGYDGVIFNNIKDYDNKMDVREVPGRVVVAFDSDQIKSVNNTNPTHDPDIRYSRKIEGGVGVNVNRGGRLHYVDKILDGDKTVETRKDHTLRDFVGKTVGLVETGRSGHPMLRGYVKIVEEIYYPDEKSFREDYDRHLVEPGSKYDIEQGGHKYGYVLEVVEVLDKEDWVDVSDKYEPGNYVSRTLYSSKRQTIDQMIDELLDDGIDDTISEIDENDIDDAVYEDVKAELDSILTKLGLSDDSLFDMDIAENILDDAIEEKKPVKEYVKLLGEGFTYLTGKKLGLKNDRIDTLLSSGYYGASIKGYAKAYITYMSPDQFLKLTTVNDEQEQRVGNWNTEVYGEYDYNKIWDKYNSDPIILIVNEGDDITQVTGHEGRHRMSKIRDLGIGQVPVLIFDYSSKYSKQYIPNLELKSQELEDGNRYAKTSVNDVYPFSQDNADTIKQIFGEGSGADYLLSAKRTTEQKLTAENEKLKADVDNLRKLVRLQGKETHGTIPTKSSIEAASKSILKANASTYNRAELDKDIANVWTKLQKGASIDSLYNDIRTIADNVVYGIKDQVEVDKQYKQMLKNLRATRVKLTENQIAYAKQRYGDRYRDMFMGKVILANDGQSLDTLWERWTEKYPEVFESMSEEDMVDGLLEAYATIKDASQYVVELDTEYVTNEVMQNITEKLWNIGTYQTVADKYADKIKAIKAEHRKEMDALKKARAEQKLADEMHYKKILAQVKAQRDAKINAIYETSKMRKETEKQRAARRESLKKIDKISKKLRKRLNEDRAKNNVPNDLKVPVINLLNALDFSSQQLLGMRGGDKAFTPTKKDLALASAMAKLSEQVSKSVEAQQKGGFVIDLPGDYAQTVADINTKITKMMEDVGNSVFVLQQMDNETLEEIADMLEVMDTSVRQMSALIASRNKHSVDDVSREIISEANAKGKRKNSSLKPLNGVDDFINKEQITPYYFFKHLGEGGMKIFQELQDGFDKYAFHITSIKNYAKENWTGKQVKEWTKTVKKFDLTKADGSTTHIEMTIPQIMSLYCLNKREQARKHIYQKGIKIAEFKNGAKMSGDVTTTLTEDNVNEILSVLTDEQIRVADAIQKHMNTVCKDWMNEITIKRFGICGAIEENYFPIKSDANALPVPASEDDAQGIYRLLNMSFTKKLNDLADNKIIVGDIFTVFTDHATDMAKYNAVALPTLDLIKVLNYSEETRTEGVSQIETLTLRDSLDTAYGHRAVRYITKMLTDLNGSARTESGSQILTALNRNYKIAAVGANLQVALLQPLSIIRAGYVMDPKYLAMGIRRRSQIKRVQEECGISAWKQLGFYQINVNRGLESMIRQEEGWFDKATDASMKLAEHLDNVTWGYIYNGCEEWARANTAFATDSAEFRQAVNDKFREVVYSTQVVDSTLTRSDYMRKTDWLSKSTSAFMAEPTLTYNMVYDAFNGFVSDIRKGASTGQALRNNGRKITRAIVTFAVSAALESILRGAISMFRDPYDEDDEDDKNLLERIRDYFIAELIPLSKIPIFKDLLSILQGYDINRFEYEGISTISTLIRKIYRYYTDEDYKGSFSYKDVYKALTGISQISGIPGNAAVREVVALWNGLCMIMGWKDSMIDL